VGLDTGSTSERRSAVSLHHEDLQTTDPITCQNEEAEGSGTLWTFCRKAHICCVFRDAVSWEIAGRPRCYYSDKQANRRGFSGYAARQISALSYIARFGTLRYEMDRG